MKSSVKKTLKEQLAHFHSIVFVVTLVGFTFYIGLNFSSISFKGCSISLLVKRI